jgi:type 1 glutamine amidotransferase
MKALFVYGGWEGHEPVQCAAIVAPMLAASGVAVTQSQSLAPYADVDYLRTFDVIVHSWSFDTITPEQEQGLLAAVESGVGLSGWHGGLLDSFRNNPTYQFMIGGQFVSHPGGQVDFTVNITDHQHPITTGIPDFSLHTEQYYMHMDPLCEVQATTTFHGQGAPWIKGIVQPVVFTKPWGAGKISACTLGHVANVFDVPEFREIVRRAVLWAARPAA